MNAKDWFGVALRVLGVWEIISATLDLTASYGIHSGWWGSDSNHEKYYVLVGIVHAVVGLLLVTNTDMIVEFSYRPRNRVVSNADDEPTSPPTGDSEQPK